MSRRRRGTAHRVTELPVGGEAQSGGAPAAALPEISLFAYSEAELVERRAVSLDEIGAFRDRPGVVWIDVDGASSKEAVERICGLYGVHPLIVEDIVTQGQRPKIDDFDTYLAVSLKMFHLAEGGDVIAEQVSVVLGKGYVLSFQEKAQKDVFEPARSALRTGKGKLRKLGADHLAYALVDAIVDNYYLVLDRLAERFEALEDEVLDAPAQDTLQRMHELRNEIIFMRRSVWPLRDVIDKLMRGSDELVRPQTTVYLKDVYDHTVQIMEQVEVMRDLVAGLLEMYLSSVSLKLNEVLKRLTVITTVFMPLSLLAGIGGMSEWTAMTGEENRWLSYPLICLGLAGLGFLTYAFFKKRKWV
jgi:magnesium transporter